METIIEPIEIEIISEEDNEQFTVIEGYAVSAQINKNKHDFSDNKALKERASTFIGKPVNADVSADGPGSHTRQVVGYITDASYKVIDGIGRVWIRAKLFKKYFPNYIEKLKAWHKEGKVGLSMEALADKFIIDVKNGIKTPLDYTFSGLGIVGNPADEGSKLLMVAELQIEVEKLSDEDKEEMKKEMEAADIAINPHEGNAMVSMMRSMMERMGSMMDMMRSMGMGKMETMGELEAETWSQAMQNEMPDSHFLYIHPDYKSGKMKDKSQGRKMPIKGPDGKLDKAHVQAAYGVLKGARGGADMPGANMSEMMKKIGNAYKSMGMEMPEEMVKMMKSEEGGTDMELEEQIKSLQADVAKESKAKEDVAMQLSSKETEVTKLNDKVKELVASLEERDNKIEELSKSEKELTELKAEIEKEKIAADRMVRAEKIRKYSDEVRKEKLEEFKAMDEKAFEALLKEREESQASGGFNNHTPANEEADKKAEEMIAELAEKHKKKLGIK